MTELRGITCHPTHVNAPRLNPKQWAGTLFTYPRGMEGWVDLGYPAMHRPGTKLATSRSRVRRPNHCTTEPASCTAVHVMKFVLDTVLQTRKPISDGWMLCLVGRSSYITMTRWLRGLWRPGLRCIAARLWPKPPRLHGRLCSCVDFR